MRVKLAGALIATLMVFGMVFGAGQAAAASLPGEPLYGLKLAAEQARMELTTDPEAKAELAAELAENRLGEISQMVASGQEVDRETAVAAQQQLSFAFALANSGEVQKVQARLAHMVTYQQSLMASEVNASGQQQEPVRALIRSMARVGQELHTTQGIETGTGGQYPELAEPAGQSGAGVQAGQQDGDGLLDGTGAQQGQAEGQGGMGVGPNYGPGTDDADMGTFDGDGYGPGAEYGPGPAEPQDETEDPGPFGWLFQLFQNEPDSGNDAPGSGSSGSNSSGSNSSGSNSSGSNSSGSGSSGSGSSGSGSQGGNR